MSERYRLGVDIGGTFTDAVLIDEESGSVMIEKVPTTPRDFSEGFLHATRRLSDKADVGPTLLSFIVHATTVATNAVLSQRGAQAGLLATEGFQDVLEIARQVRYELYNLQTEKPAPLIPRRHCVGVPERLDHRGEVVTPLDEAAVVRAIDLLLEQGVESVAVCFLHSYLNPVHERQAAEIIRRRNPDLPVSLSSDVAPEIREYWRASTAAANAYVIPVVRTYLERLERKLEGAGIGTDVHIMQSSGGIMSADDAMKRPVRMLESGPAAGVTAAAHFAKLMGLPDAISFDMGGTTAKVGLILDGRPSVLPEFEVGSASGSGTGLAKGSGYPILAPVIDLVEVGAGGGSIAWIDPGGLMRVGPQSAGADPGPVSYRRGGTEPTVTDANLVLGRLDPDSLVGGELQLSREAAREAIAAKCAWPLGMDVNEAAMGIVEIANTTMVGAMRLISVQRGYDPRDFTLVTTGGAGPLHANRLAQELGVPSIVVPPSPGVASALGMLVTNLRYDYRLTRLQPLADLRLDELNSLFARLESEARVAMKDRGLNEDHTVLERYLDLRYVGQSWNLSVPVPRTELGVADVGKLREAFDSQHERRYGFSVPDEPVELVNVGLSATGIVRKPKLREVPKGGASPDAALIAKKAVYFAESGGFTDAPFFDRYRLQVGNVVRGPAVIQEMDATTVIHPGYTAEVARHGVLLIQIE
jgi:N-methylhydantoinase A